MISRLSPSGAPIVVLTVLMIGFVLLVSLLPVARLLLEGIAPGGVFDSSLAAEVLSQASTWRALTRSLITAAGGTAISLVIGIPFAILIGLTDVRMKTALVFCFMIPMMIPPQITALSWIQLFGPASPLLKTLGLAPPLGTPHPLYSPTGIMLLLGVQHAPLVFISVRAGLRALPREMIDAARISGARHARVLRTVVLPMMTPSLVAGGALAFVSALGNFGIPAMLGIPISYATLPVLIYQRLSGFGPAIISEAAVLSVLIALLAFVGIWAQGRATSRSDYRISGLVSTTLSLRMGRWRWMADTICWLAILFVLVIPLLALVATSLVPAYGVPLSAQSATLDAYREVLLQQQSTARAFSNSLLLGLGAALCLMLLAIPLGYFISRGHGRLARFLNLAVEIPYALPGVVLAIACILLFIKPIPLLGLSLYGTLGIIFAAYLARFLVLALRPVLAGFAQLDPALEEAGKMCGAGVVTRLRTIFLPMLGPVAVAGAILVFMTAFNELTVSALLWSSGTETLGVLVYSLDDGGYTNLATAVAVLAVLAILLIMLLIQMLARFLPKGALPWQN